MDDTWLLAAPAIIDRRATVVALAHKVFGLESGTTLSIIAREYWAPLGYRFLAHRGLKPPPPGDLAIPHVPLTHLPPRYAALTARYPRVINGAVTNVSKRRIATDLLTADDSYSGAVIVKTDLNHAGIAERHVRRTRRSVLARLAAAMERRLPRHWFGCLPQDKYLVFDRKCDVPDWVWRSRGLVVQPLHVERRGDLFAVHQWYFFGSHECVSTMLANSPIVKLASVVDRLPLYWDVPDAIRRRRAELKFDYGKLDYIISDGVPVLLDANNTPNEGLEDRRHPRTMAICAALAGGLSEFLR
ncbi:MAG: hypothetical protein R3D05_17015 [Dongiaceae bacterium]